MTEPNPYIKRQLVAELRSAMYRLTQRNYRLHLDELDVENLREWLKFIRDVDVEKCSAINRALLNPWRKP